MSKKILLCLILMMLLFVATAYANMVNPAAPSKKLDLTKYHNVGNIWLRVSDYGFFGSGNDIVPQYPSLEYPGGSGIDYLYQGALWFGAKKYRRNAAGRKLFWLADPPTVERDSVIAEGDPGWLSSMKPVVDTLVTVGFDGDMGLNEFLPAYNPLESGNGDIEDLYNAYNTFDDIATASTRSQKRGVDDDGDGVIDEDFIGYTFPLRPASQLPDNFAIFGGSYIANTDNFATIGEANNVEIWFPLGFMDLADRSNTRYDFSRPQDDDGDGQIDEDGAPVSEQDFVSYYYDYSPFSYPGQRDWGRDRGSTTHVPLNVRVRQMSYQWSYEYIKNLVYVEFNVTNMNFNSAYQDTLFDCTMGIYMDSDVGPQSYGPEKASDDVSGYVLGTGYEFAYTRDQDGDGGLTTGLVGSRVCTPDPEQLQFSCWYWKVGAGPEDKNPQAIPANASTKANEKYWLLTGKNPRSGTNDYALLRGGPSGDVAEYEQPSQADTRYLFAFYGAQPNTPAYADPTQRWDLAPGRSMKIVIAVFPGDNIEDLKRSARWAKEIYGVAQNLTTVVLPDTMPHYNPPEPPEIPKLYATIAADGDQIDMYWDNRSEFSYDVKTVSTAVMGWRDPALPNYVPGLDSDPNFVDSSQFPTINGTDFRWVPGVTAPNPNALINPFSAYRLRHDFQGYTIWGRSGSGSQEDWELINKWDKIDTAVDLVDYQVNSQNDTLFTDFGGYQGVDKGLPNAMQSVNPSDPDYIDPAEKVKYYRYDDTYQFVAVAPGDPFFGWPIYSPDVNWTPALQIESDLLANDPNLPTEEERLQQALLFKHSALSNEIYLALFDDKMIPLRNHGGQVAIPDTSNDNSKLTELKKARLARRYYKSSITHPPKGLEYYAAVTAYDRGIPSQNLDFLETGRDADANMKVFFPGPLAKTNMNNIYVVPNPYVGSSSFDGRRVNDNKGDKSKRLWFVNIPERCKIRIYTLAGDLVDEIDHYGAHNEDIINVSKAAALGIAASGIHSWDLLSKNNQIIASGVYLFSVENVKTGDLKVGKFVVIK